MTTINRLTKAERERLTNYLGETHDEILRAVRGFSDRQLDFKSDPDRWKLLAYATTVWDYIHRAMPYQRPGILTPNETYAVTAFIFYMNRIVDAKTELNEKNLPKLKMPNHEGFVPDPRPDVPVRDRN